MTMLSLGVFLIRIGTEVSFNDIAKLELFSQRVVDDGNREQHAGREVAGDKHFALRAINASFQCVPLWHPGSWSGSHTMR